MYIIFCALKQCSDSTMNARSPKLRLPCGKNHNITEKVCSDFFTCVRRQPNNTSSYSKDSLSNNVKWIIVSTCQIRWPDQYDSMLLICNQAGKVSAARPQVEVTHVDTTAED